MEDSEESNPERNRKLSAIAGQSFAGGCLGRAAKRFEVVSECASRRAVKHVEIYKSVADEFAAEDMLSRERLDVLAEQIKRGVASECSSLIDMNRRDCHAAGELDTRALEDSANRIRLT